MKLSSGSVPFGTLQMLLHSYGRLTRMGTGGSLVARGFGLEALLTIKTRSLHAL